MEIEIKYLGHELKVHIEEYNPTTLEMLKETLDTFIMTVNKNTK